VGGLEHWLTGIISSWYLTAGYFGILLAMAIESCCIPLPSELVMPAAGYFVVRYPERFSLPGVALAGAIGCLIGSAAAYWIGRTGGRLLLLRYGRYILISQADSDRADRLFQRHGSAVTFFSRLLPVVRTYISLPAGIARMDFARFCAYTVLGSLPWCLALAWVGTKLGENSKTLGAVFHGLDAVILVVLVVAVSLYVWRHIRHDRAARAAHATSAAGGAASAKGARYRRPRPLPASPFDTPDRPTVPDMQSIPAWPNRFARPVSSEGGDRADAGRGSGPGGSAGRGGAGASASAPQRAGATAGSRSSGSGKRRRRR
jgi:membrane protein DedA with SNARE-associated domain